jgi:DNA-binding transcriptional LysR family regulator
VELKELRSLMALSELGSISLAAEKLHLSPPAIHKQLKILESELGVVLYEKVGRRLQLTQAAEVLLPYLKELLAQYDSALAALQEWKGMKRGVVRLGTGPSAYVLPAILKEFRRQNPAVEVLVETGNTPVLLDGLARGSLDLALLVSADLVEKEDYRVEMSWDFELVMISHQRLPPSKPRLAELKHLRFILFRKGSRMEEPIDRYFAANGFEPNVVMRFDNAEFIRSMVRAGMGISLLPLWVVDRDVKERRLSIIRPVEPPLFSKIALVRRKSGFVPRVFPLEQQNADVRTGVPFGSASTAELMPSAGPHFGDEVPLDIWKGWRQIQDWVSAGTKAWGVTISADHQFMTVADGSIRAGMLRGTRFYPANIVREGHAVLLPMPPAGTYVFRYSFTSGKGDWAETTAWRAGMAFNTGLIPVSAVNDLTHKTLPPERSFCGVDGDNLVISALKKADRGDAIVLRAFDERGQAVETPVHFLGQQRSFRPVNMLEEEAGNTDRKILRVQPYEIGTIRIALPAQLP